MITYDCECYIEEFPLNEELWGETITKRTIKPFSDQLAERLSWSTYTHERWVMTEDEISEAIINFSDRFVSHSGKPIQDIKNYLILSTGFTMGGLPTGLAQLRYASDKILPPTNLVGGIGEGIAGYFFTHRYDKEFIIRPVGKVQGCDGVLLDLRTRGYGLIEVKTTLAQKEEARREAIKHSAELLKESRAVGMFYYPPEFALSVGVSLMEPFTVNCIEFRFL